MQSEQELNPNLAWHAVAAVVIIIIDTVMSPNPSFLPDHLLPIRFILRQRISSSFERERRHCQQVDAEPFLSTSHDHCNHWQLPTIRWAWNGTNASHHTMRGIYAMSKVSEKVSNEMQKCGGQATKGGTGNHKKSFRMPGEECTLSVSFFDIATVDGYCLRYALPMTTFRQCTKCYAALFLSRHRTFEVKK